MTCLEGARKERSLKSGAGKERLKDPSVSCKEHVGRRLPDLGGIGPRWSRRTCLISTWYTVY